MVMIISQLKFSKKNIPVSKVLSESFNQAYYESKYPNSLIKQKYF